MKIIIRGELSEPPSSISCFRDVTLYTTCFLDADVLLESPYDMRDVYYRWLREHGAYDFIKEIVRKNEECGFRIGPEKANLLIDRIVHANLSSVIARLRLIGGGKKDLLH